MEDISFLSVCKQVDSPGTWTGRCLCPSEVHAVVQSLKGRICAVETLEAKAGLPCDPIMLHPRPCPALTAFSNPYTHTQTPLH